MNKLVVFLLLCSIPGVSQKVKYDYDHKKDFSKYNTYTFMGWLEGSDKYFNDLDMNRFKQAFGMEFVKRKLGYVESDADLEITLFVVIDSKSTTSSYSNRMGAAGYHASTWGWGGGFSTTTYEHEDYLNGTMVMDIYESESKLLIWQGIITRPLEASKDSKERDRKVLETVRLLMENFPPKD